MSFSEHLIPLVESQGPHRLLSIDGGGIRGVIALEVLHRIEQLLREKTQNPDLRLSDWFDFIGGTSTGAIVAAGLSLGFSVSDLQELYTVHGEAIFRKATWKERFLFNRYTHAGLEQVLKERFGVDTTFGTERLKTLLLVVLRNATTDSTWPLTNNPRAKYNDPSLDDCNLRIPLWQVVRASTAAPTFFAPETVTLGGRQFVFVDGALTPYNNPSFKMFLMATLPEYRIGWKASKEKLLLVSVGTGLYPESNPDLAAKKMHMLFTAKTAPSALMYANLVEQDLICRVLGHCIAGEEIDSEIGNLMSEQVGGILPDKLFTYARYNVDLTVSGLEKLNCAKFIGQPLHHLDAVHLMEPMREVGRAIAENTVKMEHFTPWIESRV